MKSLAGFQGRALNGVLRGRDHPKMLTLHYVALQHFREPERALSGFLGRSPKWGS
ncbi:MAG: hypothetical protein IJM06_04625 [Firmicutes bacterium]|nr:hypothetical protein [Bacillota bacterium]